MHSYLLWFHGCYLCYFLSIVYERNSKHILTRSGDKWSPFLNLLFGLKLQQKLPLKSNEYLTGFKHLRINFLKLVEKPHACKAQSKTPISILLQAFFKSNFINIKSFFLFPYMLSNFMNNFLRSNNIFCCSFPFHRSALMREYNLFHDVTQPSS